MDIELILDIQKTVMEAIIVVNVLVINVYQTIQNLVVEMARKTGDRTRDLDIETISGISKWLEDIGTDKALIKIINEIS